MTATDSFKRIPALDGVRGFAIAAVIASHFNNLLRAPVYAPLQTYAFGLGWGGVDLFFALSGFLITNILLKTRDSRTYIQDFYKARALRIWPLYYAFLLIAFVSMHFVARTALYHSLLDRNQEFFGRDPAADFAMLPWHILLVQNFLLTNVGGFSVIAPTWSLCIEEHFYLVWPLVVRAITPLRALKALCVVLLAEPVLRAMVMFSAPSLPPAWPHWINYHFTFFHLDGIAAGAALALVNHLSIKITRPQVWLVTIAATGGFVLLNLVDGVDFLREVFSFSCLALAGAGLIQLAASGVGQRVFASRPLMYLGRISFGLYLLHGPIFNILSIHAFMVRLAPHAPIALVELGFTVVAVALSLAVAAISREFFEEPFLRLKKRPRRTLVLSSA